MTDFFPDLIVVFVVNVAVAGTTCTLVLEVFIVSYSVPGGDFLAFRRL